MSDREPVLRDCFKVKKGLCVTGDTYITGNLTLSGDFGWMNPDALFTVGSIETTNLSAGKLYSSNDELVVVPFGPDYTILHPLSVVDETVFESAVQMETDLWVKGNLRVDGNAYLSAGVDGIINVGDTNTDNVVFNADIQSSLIPDTSDTYDLGSVDQHWDTLYVHNISAHGSVDIEDNLFVSGTTTLSGALSAGSDATLSSNLTVSANTTIGGTTTLSGALSAGSDVEIDGILDVELDATLSNNLTVSANTTIGGNTTLSGTFSAGGDSKIDSDLHVVGDLRVDGDVWFNANNTNGTNTINLGDDNTDNVVFNADVSSGILPDDNAAFDLGSATQQWREVYSQDVSISQDLSSNRHVNFPNLSAGGLSGNFVSIQSDGELTTSTVTVDEIEQIGTVVNETSANWDSVYASVTATSANWDSVYASVTATSANWDSVYAYVNDTSATNNPEFNDTRFVNVTGDTMTGTLNIQDTLSATGNVTFDSDLHLQGDLRVDGDVWFNANNTNGTNTINLGDDNTDNVVFNADVNSNITPDQNMAYDLGSANQHWSTLYVHDVSAHGSVSASDLYVTGSATLSSLSVSGDSTTPILRVSQLGSGNAVEVVDQTDPDNTPFVIDATGKVGIGITTPGAKLDVVGVSRFTRASTGGQPSIVTIENTATGPTYNPALEVIGDIVATGSISAAGDIYAANHSLIFSDGDPSNDTTWSKSDSITAKRVAGEWDGIHDDGSLTIPVSASVAGDFVANGDVTLGQPNTTIMLGQVGSDIIPSGDNNYNFGSLGARWKSATIQEVNADKINTSGVSAGDVYFAPLVTENTLAPGSSPSQAQSNIPYDPERLLTFSDLVSSRDTTSIVQANSADWADHAPTERIQVLTRSSLNLTFESSGDVFKEFITIATDNPAGDARWDDVTYAHAMVLPYNTVVKKIILRGTATQSATVNIGIHTNNGVTDTNSIEYKYFTETPAATAENLFTVNNEPKVFTFADTTSALEGETLGISISGTKAISTTNLSIVLAYSD